MSATIPNSMLLSDLLKATGYDCPESLQGKTFQQATAGTVTGLVAFGSAEGAVYLTEVPSADGAVKAYVPSSTGLSKVDATYAEATGVTIGDVAYARYSAGDITF